VRVNGRRGHRSQQQTISGRGWVQHNQGRASAIEPITHNEYEGGFIIGARGAKTTTRNRQRIWEGVSPTQPGEGRQRPNQHKRTNGRVRVELNRGEGREQRAQQHHNNTQRVGRGGPDSTKTGDERNTPTTQSKRHHPASLWHRERRAKGEHKGATTGQHRQRSGSTRAEERSNNPPFHPSDTTR